MPKLDSQDNSKPMSVENLQRQKKSVAGATEGTSSSNTDTPKSFQETNTPHGSKQQASAAAAVAQKFSMTKLKNATTKQQTKVLQRLMKVSSAELKSFEKEQGVSILHKWLQEYHKAKNNPMMVLLLRVLERIPISIATLKRTQIGKYFSTLQREVNLSADVLSLVTKLVNKWKNDVQLKMQAPIPKKNRNSSEQEGPTKETAASAILSESADSTDNNSIVSRKRKREQLESAGSTEEPPQKKQKKCVSWAPPDKLEHIKIYQVVRESPSQMLLSANEQQGSKLSVCVSSQLEWYKPSPIVDIRLSSQISTEKLHFAHSGGVASPPKEAPHEKFDDSKTPEFPWELKDDDSEVFSQTLSSNPNLIDDILNTVSGGGKGATQQQQTKPQEFSYPQVSPAWGHSPPAQQHNNGFSGVPPTWAPPPYAGGAPQQWQQQQQQPLYGQPQPAPQWNTNGYHVQQPRPFQPYQPQPPQYFNTYSTNQW
eukprot:CAMPEP_0117442828 /NCGR_PEP_ID=MMETSP0759-20121206/4363_1 /TAXON_ID=63605 /ORGANISM="Percolomonas cosmopolitus, Strain WS" /LENGTH=481 /DNA_ID=CAMNT_0005234749 /DNA_START=321 /DNA_END=1763 /DNA_ORIENTATION=+